jgi:3-oxoacyl-[acyl-carrier protein] reductase
MCKTLSNNYAKYNITANCVCPGFTATERLTDLAKSRAEASGVTVEEILEVFASLTSAKRIGQPDELAALITFLSSDKAAYITGTSIPVDGGYIKSLI